MVIFQGVGLGRRWARPLRLKDENTRRTSIEMGEWMGERNLMIGLKHGEKLGQDLHGITEACVHH